MANDRKEAFLRAWFDAPEGSHWAHGMSNEVEQGVSDCFDKAMAAWNADAPMSPDATGKCGGLVTVEPLEWRKYRNGDAEAVTPFGEIYTAYVNGYWRITRNGKAGKFIKATGGDDVDAAKAGAQADFDANVLHLVRSQAVELLAAERAENVELKRDRRFKQHVIDGLVVDKENLKADNAALTARVKALEDYAREATKAITGLTGGGSENFDKEIGDVFTADLPHCLERIRERYVSKVELKRLEAKLAKFGEQKPVGSYEIENGQVMSTTDYFPDGLPYPDGDLELYAHPVDSAAEIARLRDLLRQARKSLKRAPFNLFKEIDAILEDRP